jgi:hypothetical protein
MNALIPALLLLVSGCALLPSSFDSMEHARLVTINQLSHDSSICKDPVRASVTATQITAQAQWLQRYGASLPRNSRMHSMEQDLVSMSQSLSDSYTKGAVSTAYCELKLTNIHKATEAVINISAQRPRF